MVSTPLFCCGFNESYTRFLKGFYRVQIDRYLKEPLKAVIRLRGMKLKPLF